MKELICPECLKAEEKKMQVANKIDSLKEKISNLINRYEEIQQSMWNKDKDEFYDLYEANFKINPLLLDIALFCEGWIEVIDGKIVLTEEGKKIIEEIKNKKRQLKLIINQIKKLLKQVPVFVVDCYSYYGLIAEFGRIDILIEENRLTYDDKLKSGGLSVLKDKEIYDILKGKGFIIKNKETRKRLEKWLKKVETQIGK